MYKNRPVKKYAMMLMNEAFTLESFQINVPGIEHHVFTVRSSQQAIDLVVRLAEEGFGAIEVCGAFGEDLAKSMHEATNRKVFIGYIKYPSQQEEALQKFWEG